MKIKGTTVGTNMSVERVAKRLPIDATLTVEGAPADAKAVGDRLAKLDSDVYAAEYDHIGLYLIKGNFDEMVNAFRFENKIVTLSSNNPVDNRLCFYCTYYDTGYESEEHLEFVGEEYGDYARLSVYPNGRVTKNKIKIGGSVDLDTTLSEAGKAADAKAVGDKILEVYQAADVAVNEALAKKLDKYSETGATMFYGVNAKGGQYMHGGAINAVAQTVALRGVGGTLNVGTPTEQTNATTKKYVDELLKESSKSTVFDVHYISEIDTIDCSFADAVNAFREGKIVRFRISHDECKDYYCTYYCDIVEPTMRFVGSFGDNIETVCLRGDGSFSTHTGRLITDDEYSDLLSRIEALESGGGGGGSGDTMTIYVDGYEYKVPQTDNLPDLAYQWRIDECGMCGGEVSPIEYDGMENSFRWYGVTCSGCHPLGGFLLCDENGNQCDPSTPVYDGVHFTHEDY